MKKFTLFSLYFLFIIASSYANFNYVWDAKWISCPNVSLTDYGVFHFQKVFIMTEKPKEFQIRVSADNKYRLFVNGNYVTTGPALGDAGNWFYDIVDLAPYLFEGKNIVSAMVWNMGEVKAVNQITIKTAFILQGNSENEKVLNTNSTWKVLQDKSITPLRMTRDDMREYMVVGQGDSFDASKYNWDWQINENLNWGKAKELEMGLPKGIGSGADWTLVPRMIPMLEERKQRFTSIRRSTVPISNGFLSGEQTLIIAPNSKVEILLDETSIINAYPQLLVSKGKGSKIEFVYCEALVDSLWRKGNRNEIDNKTAKGLKDRFLPDGGENRFFKPLNYRTYRYVQLNITTTDEELVLNDLSQLAVGYPFNLAATFTSDNSSLKEIWDVSWRTARLCAMDTYMDCPYYERLQYVGDTRIQALISLYMTGDDRLMKQAIFMLNSSRISDGLLLSRYPSTTPQVIPGFSLYWVSMIYDYMMHRPDLDFVKQFYAGIIGVLDWYENKIDPKTGILGGTPYWHFVDWTKQWSWNMKTMTGGVPVGTVEGGSSINTLQYVYTLQQASAIFQTMGKPIEAKYYQKLADKISSAVFFQCWDLEGNILADTPQKTVFSQHANIFGILTNTIPPRLQTSVMKNILNNDSLIKASLYFRFYLTRALNHTGMADEYLSTLSVWQDALALGLSTFPENAEPSRSDCHAWSASPNYDFLATVCGIRPMEMGFARVRIAPALGKLHNVNASMPHPQGEIKVRLERKGKNGIVGEISLPKGVTGEFIWNGRKRVLSDEKNIISFKNKKEEILSDIK